MFKQYIKNKKHSYGIRLYRLTANDVYILKISIYLDKSESDDNDFGKTAAVFINSIGNYLDKGYDVLLITIIIPFLAKYLAGRYKLVPSASFRLGTRLQVGKHTYLKHCGKKEKVIQNQS